MAEQKPKMRVADNPDILETYANKLISASFDGGAVIVTLGTTRFIPDALEKSSDSIQQAFVHITSRIALSPAGAMELMGAISNILEAVKKGQAGKKTE